MQILYKHLIKNFLIKNYTFRQLYYNYKSNKKLQIFKKFGLNQDSLFVDIGGNVGLISKFVDDKFNCNIEIYEPHPGCVKILKQNFKNRQKVKINEFAVSNKNEDQKLYFHKHQKNIDDLEYSQGASLEERKDNCDIKKNIIVKSIRIDDLLKKYEFIDVLKIDIETHEYKILPSIIKNINKIGYVLCELNGKGKYNYLNDEYNFWIEEFKKKKLLNVKFFEWS